MEGHSLRQSDSESGEPPLQSGIDLEGAGRGVHAGHELCIADVLLCELRQVVHVLVLQMLSQQGNGALRVVRVNFRQVDIVDEVHQLGLTRWTEIRT